MDARTQAERPAPAKSCGRTAVANGMQPGIGCDTKGIDGEAKMPMRPGLDPADELRCSFDPMRATDRYRLVMPYREHL